MNKFIIITILLLILINPKIQGQTLVTENTWNTRDSFRIAIAIKYITESHDSNLTDLDYKSAWKIVRKLYKNKYGRYPKKSYSYFIYNDYFIFIPKYSKKFDDQMIFGGYKMIINRKNLQVMCIIRYK